MKALLPKKEIIHLIGNEIEYSYESPIFINIFKTHIIPKLWILSFELTEKGAIVDFDDKELIENNYEGKKFFTSKNKEFGIFNNNGEWRVILNKNFRWSRR